MPEILLSGVDTLFLSFFGPPRPELIRRLTEWMPEPGSRTGTPVEVEGVTFELRRGDREARFGLDNGDLWVLVREFESKHFPTLRVQFKAAFLWRVGVLEAVSTVCDWVGRVLAHVREEKVTRGDLAVDLHGLEPRLSQVGQYAGRGRRWWRPHMQFDQCTGIQFGKGGIVVRHYDKRLEARKEKAWFFDLWKQSSAYRPDETVCRLELQLQRLALKTFRPRINTFEDFWENRAKLWRYGLEKFLTFRDPVTTDSKKNRWPLNPIWAELQREGFDGAAEAMPRKRETFPDVEHLALGIFGYLKAMGGRLGERDQGRIFEMAREIYNQSCMKKGTKWSEEIEALIARFSKMGPTPPGAEGTAVG